MTSAAPQIHTDIHDIPDVVVLDMDGTLTSHKDLSPKWQKRMDKIGINMPKLIAKLRHRLARGFLGIRFKEATLQKSPIMKKLGKPQEHLETVLDTLRDAGTHIVLYSNAPGIGYGNDMLKRLGIGGAFDKVFFSEDMAAPKPAQETLTGYLTRRKLDTARIWVVGNEDGDAELATNLASDLPDATISYFMIDELQAPTACHSQEGHIVVNALKHILPANRPVAAPKACPAP